MSSSNIPSAPIDNTALIAAIVGQVKTDVDAAASTTRTQLTGDTDSIDSKLNSMTAVDGNLDNNVTAINNHTDSAMSGISVLPKLAPDLTWPSDRSSYTNRKYISGINAVGALTTALSLTGKWVINSLMFEQFISETITIKLTIDGVVIWNDTHTGVAQSNNAILGSVMGSTYMHNESSIQCDSSFLLEIQTLTDTNVNLAYSARPIK